MNRQERKPVAEPIVQMQRELEEYRRSQPRRAKLPDSIWEAASALAREHGLAGRALFIERCTVS